MRSHAIGYITYPPTPNERCHLLNDDTSIARLLSWLIWYHLRDVFHLCAKRSWIMHCETLRGSRGCWNHSSLSYTCDLYCIDRRASCSCGTRSVRRVWPTSGGVRLMHGFPSQPLWYNPRSSKEYNLFCHTNAFTLFWKIWVRSLGILWTSGWSKPYLLSMRRPHASQFSFSCSDTHRLIGSMRYTGYSSLRLLVVVESCHQHQNSAK